MNIHFTDTELYKNLLATTVATIKVGSHMYNLDNEDSDIDYLNIYVESKNNIESFMWEHHQLQYKENNTDQNFSTIQSFIRNAMTGDATINFEVLFSDELKNSNLSWLYEHRESFINYNIIKSYLGLAKRDLKYYRKGTGNLRNHTKETDKKLSHFVRGIIFAKMLLNGKFVVNMKNTKNFKEFVPDLELLTGIKNGIHNMHTDLVEYFEREMNELRNELNIRLEKGQIVRFMDSEKMRILDEDLKKYIAYNEIDVDIDYGDIFYEALEKGIEY